MSQKKIVYLVRHGQSEGNAAPVFQSYDSPLSLKGKKQAEVIAARATHLKFDTLISSPQKRAKETALAIGAATNHDIELSDLFVERIKPSSIDGKPWTDPVANKVWRDWEESITRPNFKAEDGENFNEIVARADEALQFLRNRPEESMLVVSHGHFIRTIIARVMLGDELNGQTLKRFYDLTSLENTAITVLKFENAHEQDYCWRLWTLNDHAHFAE